MTDNSSSPCYIAAMGNEQNERVEPIGVVWFLVFVAFFIGILAVGAWLNRSIAEALALGGVVCVVIGVPTAIYVVIANWWERRKMRKYGWLASGMYLSNVTEAQDKLESRR